MKNIIWELSRHKAVRQVIKSTGAFHAANWWLRRHPLVRSFRGSNVRCRVSNVVNLVAADEIAQAYPASAIPHDVRTFCDLGCNCGYFQLWLKLLTGRNPAGLMIDANVNLRSEAMWHSQANLLTDVHCYTGLVGSDRSSEFYLHRSNVASSLHPIGNNGWTKVSIQPVNVWYLWQKHFRDRKCDLLKINIEGAELQFLKSEPDFLNRVKRIIVEVHSFANSIGDVQATLKAQGFDLLVKPYGKPGFEFCIFERS